LLKREADLQELVRLVGMDSLSAADRLVLEAARMVREDFLHQNAFEDIDTYTSVKKQALLLDVIMEYYRLAAQALAKGAELEPMLEAPVLEEIGRAKLVPEDQLHALEHMKKRVAESFVTPEEPVN
jgi:V/A-type H+-transporting ATPase subunit A